MGTVSRAYINCLGGASIWRKPRKCIDTKNVESPHVLHPLIEVLEYLLHKDIVIHQSYASVGDSLLSSCV